jgi:aromatic-L-amino-acid/L-tryptophan decarboxylase
LFWTADRSALIGALSILPPYLASEAAQSSSAIDYRDWGVPLGRRFRALKLWFALRTEGVAPIQTMLREHVALTQELAGWVAAHQRLDIVAPHPLNLLCVAHTDGDEATDALISKANASGIGLFTRTVLDGRSVLRISIGARATTRHHVIGMWKQLAALADLQS